MNYDIIIPVWDIGKRGRDRIHRQIESINRNKHIPNTIYIMDGSKELDEELNSLQETNEIIKYMNIPQNVPNKSILINIGIRTSDAEYIAISDLDALYSPGFMDNVNNKITKYPNDFFVSLSCYLPEDVDYSTMRLPSWWEGWFDKSERGNDTACGGFQIAKREWWVKVRGYDERYYKLGAMDGDIVNRAQADGVEVKWLNLTKKLALYHQWHEPTKWQSEDDNGWLYKNREIHAGDNSIKRNLRGWCGAGKYKVMGDNSNHGTILSRALNILGVEDGTPPDFSIGTPSEVGLEINPYPLDLELFEDSFSSVFKRKTRSKPPAASSINIIYIFGEFIATKIFNQHFQIVPTHTAINRMEQDLCKEVLKRMCINFCKFRVFRIFKEIYIDNVELNPPVFISVNPSPFEKKSQYKFHLKISKILENNLIAGTSHLEFNYDAISSLSAESSSYLKKCVDRKSALLFGGNDIPALVASVANEVLVVTRNDREKSWLSRLNRSDRVGGLIWPIGEGEEHDEVDVILIESLFGALQIENHIEALSPGGWFILHNYPWFMLGGKHELPREIRHLIMDWNGINFKDGTMFKQKPN